MEKIEGWDPQIFVCETECRDGSANPYNETAKITHICSE